MVLSVSRRIAAPADRVWELVVDWPRQGRWMPFTRVRVLRGTGLGARVEARTGIGPLQVADPMTVIEWDPPHWCVVRHEGRVLRGTGTFRIEPVDPGSCRLTWQEDVTLPVAPARPFFDWALLRLARLAESGG